MQRKVQLMVVDDSKDFQMALLYALDSHYDITIKNNGLEALETIELNNYEAPPDLILLDIHMPIMDGITFLEILKNKNCNIPIIVLSDKIKDFDFTGLNVIEFLRKPINIDDVLELIFLLYGTDTYIKDSNKLSKNINLACKFLDES